MTSEFYANNRRRLADKLETDSVVILHSGAAPVRSNDEFYEPFSVNRNFYYFTGIEEQDVWLVMVKGGSTLREYLFIDQPDDYLIKWNGWMLTREEAAEKSGIPIGSIKYKQDMDRSIARILSYGEPNVYFAFDRLSLTAAPTPSETYCRRMAENFPALRIRNLCPIMASLRVIKTAEEIDCICKANDVTIDALRHMLKTAKPGEYEYQWVADFEYYVRRAGLNFGFSSIGASGANGVMLHYRDNNCIAEDGSLFLFDLGAEYRNYSADVSRTFPVNGKFTPRQREVYSLVLEAMEVAKDKMRGGEPRDAQSAVVNFYKKALRTIGLINDDSDVFKYYYHGVSHSLGLDVHDMSASDNYEPGMVITCEPGLYIKEEGIGIRLENDILITDGTCEDLTGNRLLKIDEIEEIMAR